MKGLTIYSLLALSGSLDASLIQQGDARVGTIESEDAQKINLSPMLGKDYGESTRLKQEDLVTAEYPKQVSRDDQVEKSNTEGPISRTLEQIQSRESTRYSSSLSAGACYKQVKRDDDPEDFHEIFKDKSKDKFKNEIDDHWISRHSDNEENSDVVKRGDDDDDKNDFHEIIKHSLKDKLKGEIKDHWFSRRDGKEETVSVESQEQRDKLIELVKQTDAKKIKKGSYSPSSWAAAAAASSAANPPFATSVQKCNERSEDDKAYTAKGSLQTIAKLLNGMLHGNGKPSRAHPRDFYSASKRQQEGASYHSDPRSTHAPSHDGAHETVRGTKNTGPTELGPIPQGWKGRVEKRDEADEADWSDDFKKAFETTVMPEVESGNDEIMGVFKEIYTKQAVDEGEKQKETKEMKKSQECELNPKTHKIKCPPSKDLVKEIHDYDAAHDLWEPRKGNGNEKR